MYSTSQRYSDKVTILRFVSIDIPQWWAPILTKQLSKNSGLQIQNCRSQAGSEKTDEETLEEGSVSRHVHLAEEVRAFDFQPGDSCSGWEI